MSTDAEYVRLIETATSDDLLRMLEVLREGNDIPGWGAGKALEYLVLRQFQIEGATIAWPFSVKLENEIVEQIDGVVYVDGLAWLLECKDHAEPVNIEPLAKLRNQLFRRPPGTLGMVFARSGFTDPAKVLARYIAPLSILLWEFGELQLAVARSRLREALRIKYRYAVERGMPDYDVREDLA